MRIIARRTLVAFIESRRRSADHGAVKAALSAWFAEAGKARWKSMADIKALYASASVVTADRVVFNIKGNDYRLVTAIDFERAIVFVKWIGSHRDYDKINVREIEYNG